MNKNRITFPSRKIKFRIWDVQEKSWVRQDYFAIKVDGGFVRHHICYNDDPDDTWDDSWNEHSKDGYIAQQFTGLKDKNGREIFEGDIVNVNDRNRLIEWRGAGFYCTWSDYALDSCWFRGGGPVVVGNVFENPELLTP
jgi:uncharacterized phage protein (TIGR01671 family)